MCVCVCVYQNLFAVSLREDKKETISVTSLIQIQT